MRAVVCQDGDLTVREVADPEPGPGQLVLEVAACGICGSDLHARHHADAVADAAAAAGYRHLMRPADAVVLGHEFSGTVVGRGPGTRRSARWDGPVVALPLLRAGADGAVHPTGLTTAAPGGYAERVLVQEAVTLPVPNGLPASRAALTEPMAVALHAVRRAEVGKRTAVVIGSGPIGLGVVAMLKARGVRTVVASDYSPARRALASAMGADVVVDPAVESPFEVRTDGWHDGPSLLATAMTSMERLRAVPRLPWHHVMKVAERAGAFPVGPVVFECVGVPGVIDSVVAAVPVETRVVVVGVCMGDDTIRPSVAINKEVDLRFVLGYTPAEFRDALHLVADGRVDVEALVTGTVGLDGVAAAFDALGDPERHAKILVDPRSPATAP
ncbi:zinc-binding dehydrogenase [Nocardioides marinquilinus]|uniref:Zinc-binding dehydrogenase n=1 Tax=Nocardioides marinquilinus TaxID=1210400 RepID=A0ABP9PM35_9ACTN